MPRPTTPELDKHLWGDCLLLATNSAKLVLQLDRAKAIYDYIRARECVVERRLRGGPTGTDGMDEDEGTD